MVVLNISLTKHSLLNNNNNNNMKNLFTLIVLVTQLSWGQMPPAVQQDLMNFEPGELIVKLKDNVDAGVTYAENGKAMSSFNIGELLGIEDKIESSSVMFHQKAIEASVLNSQKMKAVYMSKGMTNPKDPLTMKNIFVLKTLNVQENILMLIEEIKNNPNVEYAEPNYIYSIDDFEVGETIYDETTDNDSEQESSETSDATIDVDDPLYSSQTNITSTNIDDVWEQYTTGDGSQVIAILDTGGDYTHPDLEANTWINTEELNGVEGYDDDGNGYIDDIRGWDFINLDNAPLDDNMHGTHVAGIAGAVGNNGIGIAGAAWDVKLMHIKVFQSTGQGNAVTIADGVEYRYMNGATIINMSFGSYAESTTLNLALENAYTTSVLVAAAGNNQICIGPGLCPDNRPSAPLYPGAYNYILGIEDGVGLYDNYDNSGPVATSYSDLLNYELKAPGSSIISTIPGGGYAPLTGTSMATPLASGGLALYLQQRPNESKELMFGNLINTSNTNVDFLAAIEVEPTPQLTILNAATRDTINGQNGNTILEPGETIELLPLVKNYWGPTDDVRVGIAFAEFEDTSKATIVENEILIGSISAYATLQDLEETLKITISESVANNVNIKFNVTVWSGPDQEYMSDPVEIVVNVKNAILLYGVYSEDMTLTADREYLVTNNLIFTGNSILTINPGTIIKIGNGNKIGALDNAKIIAIGNKEQRIKFINEDISWGGFELVSNLVSNFDYCEIIGFNTVRGVFTWPSKNIEVSNSLFSGGYTFNLTHNGTNKTIINSNYYDNSTRFLNNNNLNTFDCNFINNTPDIQNEYTGFHFYDVYSMELGMVQGGFFEGSNIFNNQISFSAHFQGVSPPLKAYLGTYNDEFIRREIRDLYNSSDNSGLFNVDSVPETPSSTAHGIVWKVLVNDKDAQDEYALMDPVGVGSHEFKVYFQSELWIPLSIHEFLMVLLSLYIKRLLLKQELGQKMVKYIRLLMRYNIGAADGINRIRVKMLKI